jgi:hypothetical protein
VKFDDVVISYEFDDGVEKFDGKGERDDVYEKFRGSGFYQYLRRNYNGSPPNNAVFSITDTDNKSYVNYKVQTFAPPSGEEGGGEPKQAPTTPPKGSGEGSPFTAEQIIAIEREKQKTEQMRQKTLKEVQKLLKQGFTKEEIFKLLGK